MRFTRRELGQLVAGGLPPRPATPARSAIHEDAATRDSPPAHVEIGLTVPDSFGRMDLSLGDILARCIALGVPAIEVAAQSIEAFLGAPAEPDLLHPPEVTFETGLLPGEEEVYQESIDLGRKTFAAHVRAWRTAVSLTPLDAVRRQYDEAGVRIAVVKWDTLAALADDEIDYCFRLGRALGASALATALSPGGPRRLSRFADAYGMAVSVHGDIKTTPAEFEAAWAEGRLVGATVDIGNWVAGGHGSPLPFLFRHAGRLIDIHLHDRRASDGAATWFGQGDAPIPDVLRAMRDGRWPCRATIEIPYDLSTDAEQMAEIARAIAWCRACLADDERRTST